MNKNATISFIRKTFLFLGISTLLLLVSCGDNQTIDLQGTWTYRLDTAEVGEQQQWFNQQFTDAIVFPGALRDHGIGENPGLKTDWTGSIYDSSWFYNPATKKYRERDDVQFPFWLTPVKHFKGMAWYQREVEIPSSWEGKPLKLKLERPHWQTKVWVDSVLIGDQNSLSTPHIFEIPATKITTGKHKITVMVDNAIREIDPGINSHSISEHTQGNWNGIIGEMSLQVSSDNSIKQVVLTPELSTKQLKVKVILSLNGSTQPDEIKVNIKGMNHSHIVKPFTEYVSKGADTVEFAVNMGDDMKTWSEFSPNYYQAEIELKENGKQVDSKSEYFGMREFTINNLRFAINGIPVYLRGTTECSVFPITGYPPTDEAEWDRIFDICKSFGLNHMRFHSYCPPEAAFNAADRAGFYLQVEGPSWAKYSTTLGDGKPIDQYLLEETKRIIDEFGNHPSFVMMAYGNEPSGHYVGYLENWVDHFKKYDPRKVYTGASTGRSWAIINNSDYIDRSPPRGLEWKNNQPETEFDYRNNTEGQNRPYVTFEMGQWCVFPNFKEIEKYTGALQARNFQMFQEDLADKGMAEYGEEFLMASGKLQASCYKQEIEATLRTPNLAGFQLLSLNDFPGQGTALVGVLDAFWDEKGYISAKEFNKFCAPVVPLVRLPKYTYFNGDTLKAIVELANFSGSEIADLDTKWRLIKADSTLFAEGDFVSHNVAIGNGLEVGKIDLPFSNVTDAMQLTLQIEMNGYQNDWNIWLYPEFSTLNAPNDILIVDELTAEVQKKLEQGANVLLLANGKVQHGNDVVHYQTPVFWNTSWFRMRPPHTTGMLISEDHPVFKHFPTDYYTDQQWWELANRQQSMNLEDFPAGFKSIVQPIDTWFMNRKLSMLFEAKVGEGRLMVCSLDLSSNPETRRVAAYFYNCLIDYMHSEKFSPMQNVAMADVLELFEVKDRPVWKSYVHGMPE